MGIWNFFLKLVFGLMPPSIWRISRGSRLAPEHRSYERRAVDRDDFVWEVFMSATVISLLAFCAMSVGWLPLLGSGFALASDQKAVAAQSLAGRLEQIEWRVFDLRVKQCNAMKEGSSPIAYTLQLNQQIKTYRELTGKNPDLPRCDQI